jgi:hypothetical protein
MIPANMTERKIERKVEKKRETKKLIEETRYVAKEMGCSEESVRCRGSRVWKGDWASSLSWAFVALAVAEQPVAGREVVPLV